MPRAPPYPTFSFCFVFLRSPHHYSNMAGYCLCPFLSIGPRGGSSMLISVARYVSKVSNGGCKLARVQNVYTRYLFTLPRGNATASADSSGGSSRRDNRCFYKLQAYSELDRVMQAVDLPTHAYGRWRHYKKTKKNSNATNNRHNWRSEQVERRQQQAMLRGT